MSHILTFPEIMCLQPGTILQADYFGLNEEEYNCSSFQENQILDKFCDGWLFSTKISSINEDLEDIERMQLLNEKSRESNKIFKLPNQGYVTYSLKR